MKKKKQTTSLNTVLWKCFFWPGWFVSLLRRADGRLKDFDWAPRIQTFMCVFACVFWLISFSLFYHDPVLSILCARQ